jgi:hypothetical protein
VYTSSVARAYFLPALRGVLGAGEGGKLWPSMSSTGPLLLEGSPAIVVAVRPVDGRLALRCGGADSLVSESAIGDDAMQFAAYNTMQMQKKAQVFDNKELSVGSTKYTTSSSKTPTHPARHISAGVLDVGSHRCNCAIIADAGSSRQLSST